jgi:hypothetical protein
VYRHILGGCMHCALWTRLDILTACLVLAQYQSAPGSLHFRALKHLVGYLRLHPDLPLVFKRSNIHQDVSSINFSLLDAPNRDQSVSAFHIDVIPTGPNISYDSDPMSFTSCDNLYMSDDHISNKRSPMVDNETTKMVNRITPPITECLIDANLPGGLYERMATSGGSIEMGGTTTISIACKQTCMSESTTEAEIAAAAYLGKVIRWLVLFMSDLGLPFQGPIPIAEDNAATRIIAHSGKVTRNVRHVAIQTLALQSLVRNEIAVFNAIGTDNNRADHFTKPLPYPAFRNHIVSMMGIRFLTQAHAILTAKRNAEEILNG